MNSVRSVDAVLDHYRRRGHRHYGERVTELQHALQCATLALARAVDGAVDEDLVAAALLHDFGHLCHDLGEHVAARGVDVGHEHLGADALQALFPERVVAAIRLHVAAKRFLCTRDPDYLGSLSPASWQSLELQGGCMTAAESEEFLATPHASLALTVRRLDDGAKVVGMRTPTLDEFRPLLLRVSRRTEHPGAGADS